MQVVEDINLQLGGSTLSLIKYASNIITSASIDMEPVSSRLELYLHNLNHWHILLCCNPINVYSDLFYLAGKPGKGFACSAAGTLPLVLKPPEKKKMLRSHGLQK